MTKKYNYNNSLQKNQHEMRTNEEIQKIINSYPSHYSKKDFRGEGANNSKKILTRKETERDGLVFGINGRQKNIKMENFNVQYVKNLNQRKIFQLIIMLLAIKKEVIAKLVRLKGIKII